MDHRVSPYLNRERRNLDDVTGSRFDDAPVPAGLRHTDGNSPPAATPARQVRPPHPADIPHFRTLDRSARDEGCARPVDLPPRLAPTVLFVESALQERPERAYEIVLAAARVSPSMTNDIVAAALRIAPEGRDAIRRAASEAGRTTRAVA